MTLKHTFTILSFVRKLVEAESFGHSGGEKLTFSDMGYLADGARVVVTDGGNKYELILRPLEEPKERVIPLMFNDMTGEISNESGV